MFTTCSPQSNFLLSYHFLSFLSLTLTASISSLLLPGLQSAVLLRLHNGVATATFEEKLPDSNRQDVSRCVRMSSKTVISRDFSWLLSVQLGPFFLLFLNMRLPTPMESSCLLCISFREHLQMANKSVQRR